MRLSIYIFLFVIAIVGCNKGNDELTNKATEYFNRRGISFAKQQEHILVIPANGCPACIAEGIRFIQENQKEFSNTQDKNTIVFTGITSKKLLYRRLKNIDIENMSVTIDTAEIYMVDFDACEYPLILYLDNGTIVKAENQFSDSEVYRKLSKKL